MKLLELEIFLKECISKEIAFPREIMTVVVDDFYDNVPEEHHNTKDLEFNVKVGQEIARVFIIPIPKV